MVRMPENGPLIEGGLLFLSACTEVWLLIEGATIRRWASDRGNTVCCCLQTCNSILYVVVMGLVLGQSLMVISKTGIMLYAKVSPLYNVLWECIVVVYM